VALDPIRAWRQAALGSTSLAPSHTLRRTFRPTTAAGVWGGESERGQTPLSTPDVHTNLLTHTQITPHEQSPGTLPSPRSPRSPGTRTAADSRAAGTRGATPFQRPEARRRTSSNLPFRPAPAGDAPLPTRQPSRKPLRPGLSFLRPRGCCQQKGLNRPSASSRRPSVNRAVGGPPSRARHIWTAARRRPRRSAASSRAVRPPRRRRHSSSSSSSKHRRPGPAPLPPASRRGTASVTASPSPASGVRRGSKRYVSMSSSTCAPNFEPSGPRC
jgi:hypothetical protein